MCLYFHKMMHEYVLLVMDYCFVLIIATLVDASFWKCLSILCISAYTVWIYFLHRGGCISCVVIITPHHTSVQQWDRLLQSPEVPKLNCCCSGCEPHQWIARLSPNRPPMFFFLVIPPSTSFPSHASRTTSTLFVPKTRQKNLHGNW